MNKMITMIQPRPVVEEIRNKTPVAMAERSASDLDILEERINILLNNIGMTRQNFDNIRSEVGISLEESDSKGAVRPSSNRIVNATENINDVIYALESLNSDICKMRDIIGRINIEHATKARV